MAKKLNPVDGTKFVVALDRNQLNVVVQALEMYHRVAVGDLDAVADHHDFNAKCAKSALLQGISGLSAYKMAVLNLAPGERFAIDHEKVSALAALANDVRLSLRIARAQVESPGAHKIEYDPLLPDVPRAEVDVETPLDGTIEQKEHELSVGSFSKFAFLPLKVDLSAEAMADWDHKVEADLLANSVNSLSILATASKNLSGVDPSLAPDIEKEIIESSIMNTASAMINLNAEQFHSAEHHIAAMNDKKFLDLVSELAPESPAPTEQSTDYFVDGKVFSSQADLDHFKKNLATSLGLPADMLFGKPEIVFAPPAQTAPSCTPEPAQDLLLDDVFLTEIENETPKQPC